MTVGNKRSAAVLALIASALDREISDSTVEAWDVVLSVAELDEESLVDGAVELLRDWDSCWLPPPGLLLQYAREAKIERMRKTHLRLMKGGKR